VFATIERELAAVPGVTDVGGAAMPLPLNKTWGVGGSLGWSPQRGGGSTGAWYARVRPGVLKTLGAALLGGGAFTEPEHIAPPRAAIVNQAFVRKFALGDSPLGKRFGLGDKAELDIEIVGIATDAKYSTVKGEIPPQFFLPWRQEATIGRLTFYVRATVDSA